MRRVRDIIDDVLYSVGLVRKSDYANALRTSADRGYKYGFESGVDVSNVAWGKRLGVEADRMLESERPVAKFTAHAYMDAATLGQTRVVSVELDPRLFWAIDGDADKREALVDRVCAEMRGYMLGSGFGAAAAPAIDGRVGEFV